MPGTSAVPDCGGAGGQNAAAQKAPVQQHEPPSEPCKTGVWHGARVGGRVVVFGQERRCCRRQRRACRCAATTAGRNVAACKWDAT